MDARMMRETVAAGGEDNRRTAFVSNVPGYYPDRSSR